MLRKTDGLGTGAFNTGTVPENFCIISWCAVGFCGVSCQRTNALDF